MPFSQVLVPRENDLEEVADEREKKRKELRFCFSGGDDTDLKRSDDQRTLEGTERRGTKEGGARGVKQDER